MKKLYFISAVTLLMLLGPVYTAFSQAPEGFYYQAEARDSRGRLIVNTTLTIQAGILLNSPDGNPVWEERYTVKTDKYGLFSIIIGEAEGENTFSSIDWGNGKYYLSAKILYGSSTIQMPVTQLLSVPYALYAKRAGSAENETDPLFSVSPSFDISEGDISNWNDAFNWGDHSSAGYLTTETQTLADVISISNSAGSQIKNVTNPTDAQDAATKAYVDQLFKLLSIASQGVTDVDGDHYSSVLIGSQVWMAENLKTTKYNDGETIPVIEDMSSWNTLTTGACCWFDNDMNNKSIYGALYNWYTVGTSKLCPEGWHVPSDEEWTTLENYLIANGYNYDGTTSGNKIAKSMAATTNWTSSTDAGAIGNNLSLNNKSGFSGLPGGYRNDDGYFCNIGNGGYWWSSMEYPADDAWCRYLSFSSAKIYRITSRKGYGSSVRCLKDF